MFMLTFDKDVVEKLKSNHAKLIQEVKVGDNTLYKFAYDEILYLMFGKNEAIFLDTKLTF